MENATETQIVYVGFWARVLASIIDTLCLALIVVPLLVMAYGPGHLAGMSDSMFAGPLDFIVQFVFPAVAVIIFWLARGATPGKMVIGARVVDAATLGKLGTGQAILRYLGYYVSTLPLFLGLIWVAFDSRKQGWHDKIAGTLVIRAPKR
jgi:uncharacterized RDD family membrane protein YckC